MTVSGFEETIRNLTQPQPAAVAVRSVPGAESPKESAQLERLRALARPFRTNLDLGNRGAFSAHNAVELGKLSKRAYQEYNVAAGYVQFLYQDNPTHQILSFAGSYDTKDWVQDMKVVKVDRPGMGKVHSGFSEAFDSIEKDLPILDKRKPVLLTGHSLGGAVAKITALHLKQKGYDVHSVYTYGAPRVGNSEWKVAYGKAGIPTHRVVNAFDLVPRIPKLGFSHVGQPVYLSRAGKRLDHQESAWTLWPWQIAGQRIASHSMDAYLAILRKFAS